MPRRSRRVNTQTTVVSSSRTPAVTAIVETTNTRRRRPRRRLRGRRAIPSGGLAQSLLQSYVQTLNDPFSYGPVRLGWGTMVPTDTATLYLRTTYTIGTDGNIFVGMLPFISVQTQTPIYSATFSGGVSSGQGWNFSNATPVSALLAECRIVSGGIRIIPNVPMTAAPGYSYAGAVPTLSFNSLQTLVATPANYANSPLLRCGAGIDGAVALIRPMDPTSFEFLASNVSAAVSVYPTMTCPLVALTGLPASSTVLIEAVLNVEGVQTWNSSTTFLEQTGQNIAADEGLTSMFPNVERMWNSVRGLLTEAGSVNDYAAALHSAAGMANAASRAAASVANIRRSLSSSSSGAPYGPPRLVRQTAHDFFTITDG